MVVLFYFALVGAGLAAAFGLNKFLKSIKLI